MSELTGQMSLENLGVWNRPEEAEPAGYDQNGDLINPAAGGRAFANEDEAARLAVEIRAIQEQTRGVLIGAALAIGERLIQAKGLVPRGRWGEWLAENVDYSERKAQDLMRMFEEYGRATIPHTIADLDYTKALALLALPEGQREELAGRAMEEGMSTRRLQAEIDRLKAEAADRQLRLDGLLEQAEAAETAKAAIRREREEAERARGEAEAARQTTEDLKKRLEEEKGRSERETQRAADAVKRANDAAGEVRDLKARLADAGKRPAEVEERIVEVVRGEAVTLLRAAYERLIAEFKGIEALLEKVRDESPEEHAKYARALAKASGMMAERFGGDAG